MKVLSEKETLEVNGGNHFYAGVGIGILSNAIYDYIAQPSAQWFYDNVAISNNAVDALANWFASSGMAPTPIANRVDTRSGSGG